MPDDGQQREAVDMQQYRMDGAPAGRMSLRQAMRLRDILTPRFGGEFVELLITKPTDECPEAQTFRWADGDIIEVSDNGIWVTSHDFPTVVVAFFEPADAAHKGDDWASADEIQRASCVAMEVVEDEATTGIIHRPALTVLPPPPPPPVGRWTEPGEPAIPEESFEGLLDDEDDDDGEDADDDQVDASTEDARDPLEYELDAELDEVLERISHASAVPPAVTP